MLIGINGYEAVVSMFGDDPKTGLPRRVGSGEYCFELLVNLHKLDNQNQYLIYLPQNPTSDLPKESSNWHYRIVKLRKMWTLVGLSLEFLLRRSKPDVFFSPTHYLPIVLPKKSAISILDVSYIRYPQLFKKSDLNQLTKWTRYSMRKTSKIFTISQASKDDIINEYGVSGEKVIVTYPGIKEEISDKQKVINMSDLKKKYGIEGQYILFVGTLQPRKNIVRLIEAFSNVIRELRSPRQFKNFSNASVPAARYCSPRDTPSEAGSSEKFFHAKSPRSLELIIVGKKGWLYEEILEAPKKFGVEDKVRFLDFVPDEDLPILYKNALCFVLPSLYEGFGLPILEAMKYGCPVITSNVSSLPEAGGDAALYIDPLNVDDIAKNLELIISDSELRKKLIEKGYQQAKKFSWEKTARETLRALEGLMINDE